MLVLTWMNSVLFASRDEEDERKDLKKYRKFARDEQRKKRTFISQNTPTDNESNK